MSSRISKAIALAFTALILTACACSPYNDPDGQRERSADAQDEMRQDTR